MKRDAKKEHIKLQRPSIIKCKGRGMGILLMVCTI